MRVPRMERGEELIMDDTKKIPPLVLAEVRRHVVELEIRYETTVAANAAQPVTTVTSRRLRAVRDQLAEQLAAWRYLEHICTSGHYGEYVKVNEGAICGAEFSSNTDLCELEPGHPGRHFNGGTEWS